MVWSGSMLEVPGQHTPNQPGKVQVSRPGPHDWKADVLESFSHMKHQCDRSLVFSPARESTLSISSNVSQHNAPCSSIQPVSGIPTNPMPFLPSRHPWRPQSLPAVIEGRQRRDQAFACDVPWVSGKASSCRLVRGDLPRCPTFSMNFHNVSPSFPLTGLQELADGTHHSPLPEQPRNFSLPSHSSLSPVSPSSKLHDLSSMLCTSESHCQRFRPLLPFVLTSPMQHCETPFHAVGFS